MLCKMPDIREIKLGWPRSGPYRAAKATRCVILLLLIMMGLSGCRNWPDRTEPGPQISPSQARERIVALLPRRLSDREGWAQDIYAGFAAMQISPTDENLCAVIAVTEQESGFKVDPRVPGLSKIAWQEIEQRAKRFHVPMKFVRAALRVRSPGKPSFVDRIDKARTETELSQIYEDLIAFVPMGKTLLANRNPVRTGGPMQVSIRFAKQHAENKTYPYPLASTLRREVFSRRGGMYFGIAHLLDYPASYERHLYRYADFNAGHYASRNAAFQSALSLASGIPLALDGDLIWLGRAADPAKPGATELAARVIAERIGMSHRVIRRDLEKGASLKFEKTDLYERVFSLADKLEARTLPRAKMPNIKLKSPKISRNLTTQWFAERVDARHQSCMKRAQD